MFGSDDMSFYEIIGLLVSEIICSAVFTAGFINWTVWQEIDMTYPAPYFVGALVGLLGYNFGGIGFVVLRRWVMKSNAR